ncbi:sensor histidine kinase [Coleofasciculus chthonoplastes]|uniref:sensor histidine kinase n=1 Tax=Coleofasciculus chthonoplastes TaxID=64178 RepID=UPI0032FF9179
MPSLKILAPGYDYLTLNRELIVQEFSDGVPNFAESPQNLKLGEDVRLAFPELVGMEIKSRFISMTSHEFRVPLTAVFSSTELLEQYSNNWAEEKKLKHFNRIKDSVNRMTALLDDVLIANKAESGKLEFNPQPLNLNQLCRDLVEDIQLGIGKQHEISWVNSGMASKACMDKKLLRHILTNLLTNAVKYSPPGSVVQFNCHCQEQEVIWFFRSYYAKLSV